MAIDIRELDRRIIILRPAVSINRLGEEVPGDPVEIGRMAARYTAVSDGEKFRAGRSEVSYTARFVVRWSSIVDGLEHDDLIMFDGREFGIHGIKEIERKRYVEITAGGVDGS